MQVSKSYEGSIAAIGSTSARQVSYGVTTSVTCYQSRVDFVNQTIADFLHDECGVDAVYEAREGSDYKFLWVYDVPFLFSHPSNSLYYFSFYGPLSGAALNPGSSSTSNGTTGVLNGVSGYSLFFANTATSTDYKFVLYFDGDPDNGFVLRIKCQSASNIANGFYFCFAKATNMFTGKDSVVWKYGAGSTVWNGIDLNEDGTLDSGSFGTDGVMYGYPTFLNLGTAPHTNNPGKFPLIPITIWLWKLKNMYKRPWDFDLPVPVATTVASQTVVDIAGRKFIVTNADSVTITTYINCGLIEVTD